MDAGKNIILAVVLLSLSLGRCNIYAVGSAPDPKMTRWGPKLSEKELASIAKLSTPELAQMLRTGDTLHKFEALKQLKSESHGGLQKNFDLLMSIAEETGGGALIAEGLLKPIKTTAEVEEKRMVDKFLNFLEKQLKDEKVAASTKESYISSMGGVVYIRPDLLPKWDPEQFPSTLETSLLGYKNFDPNKLPIPYANDRVVGIIVKYLDSKERIVRESAIRWLGNIGANDISKADKIVSTLEAQIQKEDVLNNNEKDKEAMKTVVKDSIKRLKQNINRIKETNTTGANKGDPNTLAQIKLKLDKLAQQSEAADANKDDPNTLAQLKLKLDKLVQKYKTAAEPNNKTN
jgi:hypothetical protein